jgi:hypothetical protein
MAAMAKVSPSSRLLQIVLESFPGHHQTILALSLKDRQFRSILEDLVLAHEALQRFEARPDADRLPEIPEYRTIINELNADIREYLSANDTHSG